MITISEPAVEKAKEILTANKKTDWGFRVFIAGESCCGPAYGMDLSEKPADGDKTIEKNGLKVFIDKNASSKLDGMTIDFISEGGRQGFTITGGNPSSCSSGCKSCG